MCPALPLPGRPQIDTLAAAAPGGLFPGVARIGPRDRARGPGIAELRPDRAGPEIRRDARRSAPLGVSLCLGRSLDRMLGDRTLDLGDGATFDDEPGTDTDAPDGSFEVDPWRYRLGLGLRLHWPGSQK